jgi:hypothetical protein
VNTVKRALSGGTDLEVIRIQARQEVEQHSWEGATEQLRQLYAETILNWAPKKSGEREGAVKRVSSRLALAALRSLLP